MGELTDRAAFVHSLEQAGRLNELTTDQLAYPGIINEISDLRSANQNNLNAALNRIMDHEVSMDVGDKPATAKIEDGTLTVDKAKTLSINGVTVGNGDNVVYDDNTDTLTADHLDTFVRQGSIATNANDIHADPLTFSVGHADSIISGCLITGNIDDSTVTVYGNALQFDAHSSLKASIEDCTDAKTTFTTNGGSLIVGKNNPAIYNVQNGSLEIQNGKYKETIDANNSAKVEASAQFGFVCMIFQDPGTYWYSDNDPVKDFGINVPQGAGQYKLCIKKSPIQLFKKADGIVDLVTKQMYLSKIVSYLRHPFYGDHITSFLMAKAYEGTDAKTSALFSLSDNRVLIENVTIANPDNGFSPKDSLSLIQTLAKKGNMTRWSLV